MGRLEYSAGGLVFLLVLTLHVSGGVLKTTEEPQTDEPPSGIIVKVSEPSSEDDDREPSYFLSSVHDPSSRETTIHQLSNSVLEVTKDLISFLPRSGALRSVTVQERLVTLRGLQPAQVAALLSDRGIVVPPPTSMTCDHNTPFYRTMDGSCNNLQKPCWGKVDEPYQRWLPPAYANGVDELRMRADGGPLPSPRQVYQWVSSQMLQTSNTTYPTLSNLIVFWGQMMSHEMILTPTVTVKMWDGKQFVDAAPNCCDPHATHPDCIPIVMDYEDEFYGRGHCMDLVRSSAYAYSPFSCRQFQLGVPREQMNQITPHIDASLLYGSSEESMRKLREDGGHSAKLSMDYSTGWSYPPRRNKTCKVAHDVCDKRCFNVGERRANENPFLGSLHTMWAREHNRLVDRLRDRRWPEETLFHVVRKIVGAIMQHITYSEYLPHVLGPTFVHHLGLGVPTPDYRYDPSLNPAIFSVFATAAFRYGHSMLSERHRRHGHPIEESPLLSSDFFNMDDFCSPRHDPVSQLLWGQAEQRAQVVDNRFSKQLTNHLFSKRTNGQGLDLFSINIQRGRDHGLAPYTKWREICGLPKVSDYPDLKGSMPDDVIQRIAHVYGPGSVHEVDLYVAGVAEFPVNGGILGPTFTCVVSHQFKALKFGDRFWYENLHHPGRFTPEQIASIQRTTFASLLCRNSVIGEIQPLVFQIESLNNPKVPCNTIVGQTDLDLDLWA